MVTKTSRSHRSDLFRLTTDAEEQRSAVEVLLYDLLGASIIHAEDWERLAVLDREHLLRCQEKEKALSLLVKHGLISDYQAARIGAGTIFGLVLGNYRIVDRIGAGGMAVVFKAEHLELRHTVAIKVLPMSRGQDPRLETRFTAEMRTVARLRHPNIVTAMDAGRAFSHDPDAPVLWYLVMEYVPGQDLEEYVLARGPLSIAKSCSLAHQVACALAETAKFNLVHRDIKPSNILLTPEDQAKLLDFGLSRHIEHRVTQPGTVLGTIDFMAPEQARDASSVDIRADIYGLGGALFWCLTGQLPFGAPGSATEALVRRLTQPPPSARVFVPDMPAELDEVIAKMMALSPDDRYPNPQAVMRALLPFLRPDSQIHDPHRPAPLILNREHRSATSVERARSMELAAPHQHRILIVDDEPSIREFCREVLRADGLQCDGAADGASALIACEAATANGTPYDLLLLDVNMPGMSGPELLRHLRQGPPCPNVKIIMFSGMASSDEMSQMLLAGADEYLTKPFSVLQLQGRVQAALRLKDAQDRSGLLNQRLQAVNAELERNLSSRDGDLAHARNALVMALAKLVEQRENEGCGHLPRLQRYCRCLAEAAMLTQSFVGQIDAAFVDMLVSCAPLHDIGKVGLPDHILLKPGKFGQEERILMQAHTTIGASLLEEVAKEHGAALAFLQMAIDIIRHHHERFDGTGYPDRLAGSAIPLAARIVAIADVYDALRSRRSYKPALSHHAARQLITEASQGQFDLALVQVFVGCAAEFDRIFREVPG